MSLATKDELKQYLGITSSAEDERLDALLARASRIVTHYCNQESFEAATFTDEFYDGSGTDLLQLKRSPVTAVTAVKELGVALTVGNDPSVEPAPQVLWYEDGRLLRPDGLLFVCKPRHYKVTYTAGYAAGQVPPPIVQAVLDLCALFLREPDRIGIQNKTVGQQTTSFVRTLPEGVREGLDHYIRRRAA